MNALKPGSWAILAMLAAGVTVNAQTPAAFSDEEVSAGGATTTRFSLYSTCRTKIGGRELTFEEREQCLKVQEARATELVSAGGVTTLKADLNENCLRMNLSHRERVECSTVQAALLPPLDPSRREEFGESYDPKKYLECRLKNGPAVADCDLYRLRRKPHPEYWPNLSLPRPVIPDGDKKVYRPGMSSEDYFKALCEAEAGEFIYKTVEDVEAVYQIRPRTEPSRNETLDRYVLEAPMFLDAQIPTSWVFLQGKGGGAYPAFETPNLSNAERPSSSPYLRASRYVVERDHQDKERIKRFPPAPVAELQSRYGYYWYGIKRERDREMAVAGGEMVVVDLRTNEVPAVKRGFSLGVTDRWGKGYSPTGIGWSVGGVCPPRGDPPYVLQHHRSSDKRFLNSVLKPKASAISDGEKNERDHYLV